jgi:hypothetical protein
VFLNEDQFPFVESLRRAWADIRTECLALATDSFEPWVQRQMYGEGWSVYGLVARLLCEIGGRPPVTTLRSSP